MEYHMTRTAWKFFAVAVAILISIMAFAFIKDSIF